MAALEPIEAFPISELANATQALPAEGLRHSAQTLINALESTGEQRTEYWQNRMRPYLKFIGPKSQYNITLELSEIFAELCIKAQDAFPVALHDLKFWLQRLEYPDDIVHLLHEPGLCSHFPKDALTYLDRVIGDSAQWPPDDLKNCLDTIQNSQPKLGSDDRFARLREYLRRST